MTDFTTMEKLTTRQSATYGATLRFGEKVIHTDYSFRNGFICEVYEFVDSLDDFSECEARLSLIAEKNGFEDNGHAVQWGLAQ